MAQHTLLILAFVFINTPSLILTGTFIVIGLFVAATNTYGQEADSTKRTFFINPKPPSFKTSPHQERSIGSFSLPESGVFEEPPSTEYYTFPFKGQYYLDLAVENYREQQRDKLGLGWLFQFLNAIAPYLNNQFQFGVYGINDMGVVERDNPLFQSYKRNEIE